MDNKQSNSVARDFEIENGVLKKYIGNDSAVVIPNGVTEIVEDAFDSCDSLLSVVSVEIPDSVTKIDSYAFYYCDSLESITVARGNAVYHSDGNCLIETASKTLVLGCKNSVIPADGSVKIIGDLAFCGCESLTDIKIPKGVTKIGFMAFYCCRSLASMDMPDGVTDIGDYAFKFCDSLTDVKMPDSVTSLGECAFSMCPLLESIVIPDGLTSIGELAFFGCWSLASIKIPKNCALGYGCFPEDCKVIKM